MISMVKRLRNSNSPLFHLATWHCVHGEKITYSNSCWQSQPRHNNPIADGKLFRYSSLLPVTNFVIDLRLFGSI